MSTSTDLRASRLSSAVAGGLVLALAFAQLPALAAVSEADADGAKKLYGEGVRLEASDLPTARDRFKGAFKLRPSPIIGVKLGDVHERLGELLEARQVYRRCETVRADEFLDVGVKDESQNAKDARQEAHRRAESLERRIPSITIRLDSLPKGAQPKVSVDDADIPIEALAVPRSVNPGKHVVLVKIEGQATKKSAFELAEGQTRVVSVDLTPDPSEGAPTTGTPRVTPPPEGTPGAPANHDVGVASPGLSTMTWVGFGIGGAGLIVGGVTGILAMGKASTVKDNCPNQICPPAFHDDLDAGKRYSTISTIGFGVALVGVGVGVWGLLSSPSAEAAKPAATAFVHPWVGIGSVGVTGAF
jgi:hypothetical protein